ncbi:MAG: hypothetical protein GEU94_14235 [Micromonosporaceae bacterium]|nr:hypothetical protein [Micromonosporaceae bacterium]
MRGLLSHGGFIGWGDCLVLGVPVAGGRGLVSRARVVVVGAAAFGLLTGVAVWAVAEPACDGHLRLTVAASPDIAPAVRESGRRWQRQQPRIGGRCVKLRVRAADPARVAAVAGQKLGGDLDVAGAHVSPSADPDLPDAWLPDSSSWLARLRGIDRAAIPAFAPPIAMSPVVLALPEPAARAGGWPAEQIGWDYVLAGARPKSSLSVATLEPRRSAVGLSSLLLTGMLATSAAKTAGQDPETAVLGAYRALAAERVATVGELVGILPRSDRPEELRRRVGAALLSEHSIREYDASRPAVPLAAVYPEPAAPPLDYPYAIMARVSTGEARAAARFQSWLLAEPSRRLFTRHGFRAPDGSGGPDFPTGNGITAEPLPPPREVTPEAVREALRRWTKASAP